MSQQLSDTSGFLRARRVLSLTPGVEGDSVFWEGGRIRQIGRAAAVKKSVPPGVPQYDLPDTLVTPGLVDGHTHLAMWALGRRRAQLTGARSRQEALGRVAAAQPFRGWVLGHGWDANNWMERPDRHALDQIHECPVYLDSLDVHAAWVNTAALQIAGVTRGTEDPSGGRIVRDGNGNPTGLLLEHATDLIRSHVPQPSGSDLDEALSEAQLEAHRMGVTGIQDVEEMAVLAAFGRLEAAGRLRLRILFHPPVAALGDLIAHGYRSGQGSDWVTIGGVKMFLDGSLGSRTAWMLEPYTGSGDCGMPVTSEVTAREAMTTAAAAGLATTAHAIGDAAVRRALDLLTVLPPLAIPHRIEHFQCVHPADLDRAARAGLVVSMQPAHLLADIPLVEQHWGRRGEGAYAFRSLLATGARLVFGSDVPVASLDPRQGVYAALERTAYDGGPRGGWHAEQKLTLAEALHAYTLEAGRAAAAGHRRGVLAPGFDADLVAWSVDPAAEHGDGRAFRDASAMLTVVGGELVMRA